jgi:hypothetical protein
MVDLAMAMLFDELGGPLILRKKLPEAAGVIQAWSCGNTFASQ